MERHASALKAARQAKRHETRNTSAIARMRTHIRKLRIATAQKYDKKDAAIKALTPLLNVTQSVIMTTARHGIIKRPTASRYVARLSKHVHETISRLGA